MFINILAQFIVFRPRSETKEVKSDNKITLNQKYILLFFLKHTVKLNTEKVIFYE